MNVFQLPTPLTLNTMFKNIARGGKTMRAATTKYKDWKQEAAELLMMQGAKPLGDGPFKIEYKVGTIRSDSGHKIGSNSDIDNRIKCMADALVDAEIIPDDSMKYVTGFTADWIPGFIGAQVTIRKTPPQEVDQQGSWDGDNTEGETA